LRAPLGRPFLCAFRKRIWEEFGADGGELNPLSLIVLRGLAPISCLPPDLQSGALHPSVPGFPPDVGSDRDE
jgi:hypothetical protein